MSEADGKAKPQEAEGGTIDASANLKELAAVVGVTLAGDGAPVVRVEEDLNAVATRLGEIVARLDLYEMNGELVFFDYEGNRQPMGHTVFSTWINDHVIVASRFDKDTGKPLPGRLKLDESAIVLACQNFRRHVRKITGVNRVRLPVVRGDGTLEKLPWGYDAETKIYTVPGGLDYREDVDLEACRVGFFREFEDFPFSTPRSMAVQVAAMLALFCRHLPGGDALRPGLLWLGNKVGCGKSVLAKASLYPVMGVATAAKLKENESADKELEAFVRAGVSYVFFDNVYGGISSASLDQLLTSKRSTGRAMGGHAIFDVANTAQLLVTGNRLELNEDAARRFAIVDLFEKGDVNHRQITKRLDDDLMMEEPWRAAMLGYMWGLVRHWHEAGMPSAKISMPTYERYCGMLGGIVVAAGYEEPFQPAEIPDAVSPEKAEFLQLVAAALAEMEGEAEKNFTLEDLARLSRSAQIFQKQVGTQAEGTKLTIKEEGLGRDERWAAADKGYMTPAHRSAFGKRIVKEVGTNPVLAGETIEFGRREQSRKAAFTVRRIFAPQ